MTDTTIVVAPPPTPDPKNPSGWKHRRRIAFGTLLYCGVVIAVLAYRGPDTELSRTIVSVLAAVAIAALSTYGITASWERTKGLP